MLSPCSKGAVRRALSQLEGPIRVTLPVVDDHARPPPRRPSRCRPGPARPGQARACFSAEVMIGVQCQSLRHSEHAHLLSNIEKLTLPIFGRMLPSRFWSPTGDWSVSWKPPVHRILVAFRLFVASLHFNPRPSSSARRRVRGPRAPLCWAASAQVHPGQVGPGGSPHPR